MATTTITYQEFDRTITARESKRRTSTGHRIYMRQVRSLAVCALEEAQRKVPFFIDTCLVALFDPVEKYRRVGRSRGTGAAGVRADECALSGSIMHR